MQTDNLLRLLISGLCLQLAALATALQGAEDAKRFHHEGLSLSVPESWSREAPAEPAGLALAEGRWVAVWRWTRGAAAAANLTLMASPRKMEVSESARPLARRAVERELLASSCGDRLRILDFQCTEIGGLDAYRAEVAREVRGAAVRQLLYVVSADRTFLLTFSALEEDFSSSRGEFEKIISSVAAEQPPSPVGTMPPWLCGSALGLFLGLAAAARHGQKAIRFGRSWRSTSASPLLQSDS